MKGIKKVKDRFYKVIPNPLGEVMDFIRESNAIESEYSQEAFDDAVKAWEYLIQQKELTPEVVLKTHELLTKRLLHEDACGKFRNCAVYVGGREGKPWQEIPELITEWCKDVATSLIVPGKNGNNKGHNIKIDHVEYERIHPFVDGNGRTGRMFMNWERLKVGLPLLIIHADYNTGTEQRDYYKWFNENLYD